MSVSELEEQVRTAHVAVLTYEALEFLPGFTDEDRSKMESARNDLASLKEKLQRATIEECLSRVRNRG